MRSGGKSSAALRSAGTDDGTAGFGAHAGTKTVTSFTFCITRLKCSFAHLLHPLAVSWLAWLLTDLATPLFTQKYVVISRYYVMPGRSSKTW